MAQEGHYVVETTATLSSRADLAGDASHLHGRYTQGRDMPEELRKDNPGLTVTIAQWSPGPAQMSSKGR